MKRINFLWLLLSVVCCFGFMSCDILNGPDNPNSNKDFVYSKTGMYVGITGFSDAINFYGSDEYRYKILSNAKPYESFIDGLSMGDATVLYYAVDNNLSYLEKCAFPDDVSSVSIITFTDGLDQGSRAYDQDNNYTANSKSYVEAIAEKLQRIKINNLPINAYAIGVRGSDVKGDAVATFENNLLKLSSSKENAMQVSNMDEVNAKFETIAESLYSKTETHSLTITIPMPSENEKERFTFDDVTDPTKSKCYLEGVYANGALNDIKYAGCQSSSGAKVLETYAGGVKIQFLFENFTDLKGNAISTIKMQQWHMEEGATTWNRNSEFKPTESINVEEKRTSAVVMLILDCSSSLGASDFAKVKTAAKNFIKTLTGEATSKEPDTPDNPTTNNHEYVDLGLSVKWATCNVGATKPEDYGDYFAWGETQPKSNYDWSTYKWCNGSPYTLTKYCTDSYYGTIDNKTTLELSDDAARANWGGSWRMPTKEEQDELHNNCEWEWTTQNGVKGYKVTSEKKGYTKNSIFLPAAGYRVGSSLSGVGSDGNYWSSSLYTLNPTYAYCLYFDSSNVYWHYFCHRYRGQSVRPVCP